MSALTRDLRQLLESTHGRVRVFGEVSNFDVHRVSGHAYFTLKDAEAQLRCVMWRDQVIRLRFRPKDGQELVARGRVTVYERGGQMQLVAEALDLRGEGALLLAFRELAEKLRLEGVTSSEQKRKVPRFPRGVGIVTSRDGAALRDVVRTILRRDPKAYIVLSATPVQGAGSAPEIAEAIDRLDATGAVDVILVVRGGGSLEDLWAFNEEPVARAILRTRFPVVTGIGHETDTTIADLVADLSASTPTAAAELVSPIRAELVARVAELFERAHGAVWARLEAERRAWTATSRGVRAPRHRIELEAQRLDELVFRSEQFVLRAIEARRKRVVALDARLARLEPSTRLAEQRARFDRARHELLARTASRLEGFEASLREHEHRLASARPTTSDARARLSALSLRLEAATRTTIATHRQRVALGAKSLEALSPLAVLGRGYALVSKQQALVRDAAEVAPGDSLEIRLARGILGVVVTHATTGES